MSGQAQQEAPTDASKLLPLAYNELRKLAAARMANEAAAEIAKLRFFGGLTLEEAGQVMSVTERTANRYWAFARVWLFDEMRQTLGR